MGSPPPSPPVVTLNCAMISIAKGIIIFLFIALGIFYVTGFLSLPNSIISKDPPSQLPSNVTQEIDNIRSDNSSYISRWEANKTEQTVMIYLNCTQWMKKNKIPDMVIDNWTIRLILDPEIDETYTNITEKFIPEWSRAHPGQVIGYVDAHACNRKMWVTIFNISRENENSKEFIDGWQIIFVRAT